MAKQKPNAIDRLAASIINDILNMTDEEIMAEIIADGKTIKQINQEKQDFLERVVKDKTVTKL